MRVAPLAVEVKEMVSQAAASPEVMEPLAPPLAALAAVARTAALVVELPVAPLVFSALAAAVAMAVLVVGAKVFRVEAALALPAPARAAGTSTRMTVAPEVSLSSLIQHPHVRCDVPLCARIIVELLISYDL